MNSQMTFHTIQQAAWILGVSRPAVSRAIRTGELRAVRTRSGLRMSSTELARLLGAAKQDGGAACTSMTSG
ncbi:helix-turn-helix domain-containing protein [Amycolatopsis orientalis]|uniref:helix-turn-helix domain-containing protein n=1 Tax=Amycolatopsis orientalis TaxID=31958 RepID=UPI00055E66D2|nr:helix-turn-helix domain-containing protein [Amycolatopsis orientalis]